MVDFSLSITAFRYNNTLAKKKINKKIQQNSELRNKVGDARGLALEWATPRYANRMKTGFIPDSETYIVYFINLKSAV
jgi:hypothetical protein